MSARDDSPATPEPARSGPKKTTAVMATSFDSAVKWAGGAAVLFGVLSDVLRPLAPFTAYIAFAAAVATLIILIALALKWVLLERAMPALIFASAIALISGGVYFAQRTTQAENGLLAKLSPPIQKAQETLGLTARRVETLETRATQAESDIKSLQSRFAQLDGQTAPTPGATRPEQLYRNARLRAQSGDAAGAAEDYRAFFRARVEAVDPALRFAELIETRSGPEAAAQALDAAMADGPRRVLALARANVAPSAQRFAALSETIQRDRGEPAGYYLRARARGPEAFVAQTLADKRQELADLTRFLSLGADGRLLDSFIDQTMARQWIESATQRAAALRQMGDALHQAPTLSLTPLPEGWMAMVNLPELATELTWRPSGAGDWRTAPPMAALNPLTGRPMPDPNLTLDAPKWPLALTVAYRDARGEMQGPFDLLVDQKAALAAIRRAAEMSPTTWLTFSGDADAPTLFNGAALFACAIESARYGLDGAEPDRPLPMPPCDLSRPLGMAQDTAALIVATPKGTRSAKAQLTLKDGSTSAIRETRR